MAENDVELDMNVEEVAEDDVEMLGGGENGEDETNLPNIEPDVPVKVTFLE